MYKRQANTETTTNLVNLLTSEGRFQDAKDLVAGYLPLDPNSKVLQRLLTATEARLKASGEVAAQTAALQAAPKDRQRLAALLQSLMILGRTEEVDRTISNAVATTPNDVGFLRDMINFYAQQGKIAQALLIAEDLEKAQPDQWDVPYTIAKYRFITGDREGSYAALHKAIQLGGNAALQQIAREQLFQQVSGDPAFQQAVQPGDAAREQEVGERVSNALGKLLQGKSATPAPARHP